MPQKSNKYGIKIFAIVDGKTWYTLNLEVCIGKKPEGPFLFLIKKAIHFENSNVIALFVW